MPLRNNDASQELFGNYRALLASDNRRRSNAPSGCSQISQSTANYLKRQWAPNAGNSWSQSSRKGFEDKYGCKRWVTLSVSKRKSRVVDFHALGGGKSFLWHFKIV